MAAEFTPEQIFHQKAVFQNEAFSTKDNLVMLAFDDNYITPSINLILSIAKHNPDNVSFICTCPVMKQENIQALLELSIGVQIRIYEFNMKLDLGRWVLSAVLRIFSPWLLEDNIHRVLYMDSDILCTGNLSDLFQTEVPCIAMCNEISGNVSMIQQGNIRPHMPTGIYCNAGVVIFNLDYMRNHYQFHEFFTFLQDINGKVSFLDQDFLNLFFQDKIKVLNAFHYNFQAYELLGTRFYNAAMKNCRLIHFSVGKPWLYKSKLCFIRLYLKHSLYPPMIARVKQTYWKSVAYCPIRFARRMLSPVKQAILAAKNK